MPPERQASALHSSVTAASESVPALAAPRPASVNRTLAVLLAATVANQAFGQLFNLVLFFVLIPSQVGLINWGTAAVGIVFFIADLGVETSLVVAVKQRPVPLAVMTTLVGTVRLAFAAIALLFWLLARQLSLFGSAELSVLLIIGLASVVRSLESPFVAHLQVRDHQAAAAAIQVVPTAFRFLGVVALALAHSLGVTSALIAWLVGESIGLVSMAAAARLVPDATVVGDMRRLARQIFRSAPVIGIAQALLVGQNRVDWLIVAAFSSYASLANYAIANKALELLILAGSVFGRNALPWFVEGWHTRNLTKSVRLVNLGLVGAGLGLALWGGDILNLLFGHKYAAANTVIPLLAVLAPALGSYEMAQFASYARGRAGTAVIAGGAGLAAQVMVDLLTVPHLGIIGAAYGMWAYAMLALPIVLILGRRHVMPARAALELMVTSAVLPGLLVLTSITGLGGRL